MDRLRSSYLGFSLPSPFIASAGPLTRRVDTLRALEDAGVSAVVLPSVFEEQLQREKAFKDHFLQAHTDALSEAHSFFPDPDLYDAEPERALNLIRDAKAAVDCPVIASLNGTTSEGWTAFASQMAAAGADALELNLYQISSDPSRSGAMIEDLHVDTVREVCSTVDIPVAVKLGPYYTAFAHLAARFEDAGASALVLFNRFYQPDFDVESRTASLSLKLSTSRDVLLPLSWIAMLRGQRKLHLAATSGIHQTEDVVKVLLAGADAVCSTSGVLKKGPGHFVDLRDGLLHWMDRHEIETVDGMRGSMRREFTENPELFERANYIKLLQSGDWNAGAC